MYHFCTYFDRKYLYKGLALYRSLERHSPEFLLYVLCFDDVTFNLLSRMELPYLRPIQQEEFERADPELLAAKAGRSPVEYFWTCTPSLPLYLLGRESGIDLITYLDADLLFFSDPTPIFDELGADSILMTEHRYSEELKVLEARGRYNVQMMGFRRDSHGLACLRWWRDRCIEWCHNRLEGDRFGDQKYLDDWPQRFQGVHVLQHSGAGVAPWNVSRYTVEERDGRMCIQGQPLIFYHFHQFRLLSGGRFYLASSLYTREKPLPRSIYHRYQAAIRQSMAEVSQVEPAFACGVDSYLPVMLEAAARRYLPVGLKNAVKRVVSLR